MKTYYPTYRYDLNFHRRLSSILIVFYILLCAAFLALTLLGYETTEYDFPWRYATYPITAIGILVGIAAFIASFHNSRRIMWWYLYYNNGISLTYLLIYFVARLIWGTLPNFPLSLSFIGSFLTFTVVQDYYMLAYFRLLDFHRVFLFYSKQTDINKYINHENGSITSDVSSSFTTNPYSRKDSEGLRNSMNSNEDEDYNYDTPRDPNEESNYAIFQEDGNEYVEKSGKRKKRAKKVSDRYLLEGLYVPIESLKPIMNDLNQYPTMTDLSQMTVYIDGSAFNFTTFCYLEEKFAPILKLRRISQRRQRKPKPHGEKGIKTILDRSADKNEMNETDLGQNNNVSEIPTNLDQQSLPKKVNKLNTDSEQSDLNEQLIPQGYNTSPKDKYISG